MNNQINLRIAQFNMVFRSVSLITLICLIFSCFLSFVNLPNSTQIQLFAALSTNWKLGFGVMLGLLAGRNYSQDN
jgi:hypothetical protein